MLSAPSRIFADSGHRILDNVTNQTVIEVDTEFAVSDARCIEQVAHETFNLLNLTVR